jgi:cleavage and polyadenylation specificity factor subunit 2
VCPSHLQLSGAAKSSRISPLVYLLQVDDINILFDCRSPDWCPEPTSSQNGRENKFPYIVIILKSASDTWLASNFRCVNDSYRISPSLDFGLLSHRDLPHPGSCLYAYSGRGLKTLAYSTLPVQTMARIAATEERSRWFLRRGGCQYRRGASCTKFRR